MFKEKPTCRISGKSDLIKVIDLGIQKYCGHFPSSIDEEIPGLTFIRVVGVKWITTTV